MFKFCTHVAVAMALLSASSAAWAQDVRYSWFEVSFVGQDIDRNATFVDSAIGQTVDISAKDGDGVRFRGSFGTWNNLFAFVEFTSSDIDVDALVTNALGQFPASDNFDYTAIRGGLGVRWPLSPRTDIYGAISYDSSEFDFGSFAGENFDADDQDIGAEAGIRSMVGDKLELRARARYSGVGDVDLNTGVFDTDTLFGVGFGYELVRGLSITGDFESGEFSSWNVGFRLDLDED